MNLRDREVARAGLERCILIAVFEACEEPSFVLSDWTTQGCAVLFSVKWWRGKRTVECRRQSLQIAIALVRRLGKHGSLINRQFGAGVRLAGVTTDMPPVATAPDRLVRTNSVQPVRFAPALVRLEPLLKTSNWCAAWSAGYVDFECPWTRPHVRPRLLAKMVRE